MTASDKFSYFYRSGVPHFVIETFFSISANFRGISGGWEFEWLGCLDISCFRISELLFLKDVGGWEIRNFLFCFLLERDEDSSSHLPLLKQFFLTLLLPEKRKMLSNKKYYSICHFLEKVFLCVAQKRVCLKSKRGNLVGWGSLKSPIQLQIIHLQHEK